MSDSSTTPVRPVSLFTTIFVLALFVSFLLFVRYYYQPATVAPQNDVADNLPEDSAWRATNASRRAVLEELRQKEAIQVTSYNWVDRDAGVVQLPIERAMELTAEKYGAKR